MQKTCHADHSQCITLLSALQKLMVKAAIDQIPVTLKGLGTFSSHKHPEYIQENPQTGEQILFPPRISYRMQSETPDNPGEAKTISTELAELTQLPLSLSSSFLEAVASVITSRMKQHEEVEVHGFGTFHVIEAHQHELQRIAFNPDEQLRELVNAPFNCFEPVVIKEAASAPSVSVSPTLENDVQASESVIFSEEKDVQPSESVIFSEEKDIQPSESAIFSEEKDVQPSESAIISEKEDVQALEQGNPEVVKAVPATEAAEPAPIKAATAMEKEEKSSNALLYTALSLILLACITLVVYLFCLHTDSGETVVLPEEIIPVEEITPVVAAVDTSSVDSVAADTLLAQVVDTLQVPAVEPKPVAESKPAVEPTPAKPAEVAAPKQPEPKTFHRLLGADGQPVTVTLNPGERLTIVSLNQYGDKAFWPYIFEVNSDRIKAPNLVQAGMKLYLPDPAYYHIDANDEESLRKAKNRGAQLLK